MAVRDVNAVHYQCFHTRSPRYDIANQWKYSLSTLLEGMSHGSHCTFHSARTVNDQLSQNIIYICSASFLDFLGSIFSLLSIAANNLLE